MKRFACAFLAIVLLLLAGCKDETSPPASSAAGAQGPGLERHSLAADARAVLLEENVPAQVLLEGEAYSGQRVETTPQLLSGIADALYFGAEIGTEESSSAHREERDSASDVPASQPLESTQAPQITLSVPGAQLWATLQKQGERCAVSLTIGAQDASLDYPAAVYDTVLALAEANLVPSSLKVEGEVVALHPASPAADGMTTQWMECSGGLAGLYTWPSDENSGEAVSALEIFDPGSGESLYYSEIGAEALRMEAASFAACDMRVVMADGAMWYLNSQSPDVKPYYFYLPKALRDRLLAPLPTNRPVFRGYDGGTGQGALWAVADEEGLAWARRSSSGSIENDVILENLPEDLGWDGDMPPQFGDVRLMDGGAILVATVVLPGSQMGEAGIFTYHIASGTMNWYFGMFKPMLADLRFVSDTELAVTGDTETFRLNVATGETSRTPSPQGIHLGITPDCRRYVFSGRALNPDGTWTTTLYTDQQPTPFLSATGEEKALQTRGITDRYVILSLRENGAETWHLAQWPQSKE